MHIIKITAKDTRLAGAEYLRRLVNMSHWWAGEYSKVVTHHVYRPVAARQVTLGEYVEC